MKQTLFSALMCVSLLLVSCASDPSGPQQKEDEDPGPVVLEDGHVFRFFTLEDGKAPRLRWVGDGDGPFAESPENTDEPWIGFGQPFRIEWEITSEEGRVTGYQFRFDHEEGTPFYPRSGGAAVYEAIESLEFSASVDAETAGPACFNDPDCFRTIRLPSDQYALEIRAQDETGRERSEPEFQIRFHTNYAPIAIFQEDEVAGCDEPAHFPRYEFVPEAGASMDCALLDGDTIPSGSRVRIRVDGLDRFDAENFADGRCCDLPISGAGGEIRYQAQVEITAETDRGIDAEWFTFFGPEADENELEFETGPFDYRIIAQTIDEHARRSDSVGFFAFRSGFDPEIVSVEPADGAQIYLRNPLDGNWPDNEVDYEVELDSRYWDPEAKRVLRFPAEGREEVSGHLFRIPLRFEGRAHPSEPLPANPNPSVHGGVLAWAYEWNGEYDPQNALQDGPGFDDLGEFSESPSPNLWSAEGEEAVELWVPLGLWFQPGLYLDGVDPESKEEIMAAELLERLGQIDFLVRGRSSWAAAVDRCPPMTPAQRASPEGDQRCLPEQPIMNVGRYTAVAVQQLELRLGIDRGNTGSRTELWPAPAPAAAERPSAAAVQRRIRSPREKS